MPNHHPVVGSWKVAVSVPGAPSGLINLARLSLDGGVVVAFPSPSPAPPGASHRVEYWTPALGSWVAENDREAAMAFVALGADENGASVGTHTVTAHVAANDAGSGWQGPFQIEIAGPDGSVRMTVQGTVSAAPIGPEAPRN